MSGRLSLQAALAVAQGALARAEESGIRKLSVAVLDRGGHPIVTLRSDEAGHFGLGLATAKAASVLGFNVASSSILADAFSHQPNVVAALAAATGGAFLPIAGGVAIRDAAGELIGAAGAAGGAPEQDEQMLLHGIEAAGF